MGPNVAQQLIGSHLVTGEMVPGNEIGLRIDQTLTQDAAGAMVMLELESLGLERVTTSAPAAAGPPGRLTAKPGGRPRPAPSRLPSRLS